MTLRRGALIGIAAGLVLIVAGALLRFVVVPGQAQFPDDVDTTRTYTGTLDIVNAEALASFDIANAFLTDIPVQIERRVTTEQVDGGQALVRSKAEVIGPTGQVIIGSDDWYTIDRKTMEHVPNFTDEDRVFEGRSGLVVGWPIDAEPEDYQGWNGDPRTPVTLTYAGEEERGGIDTYVFTASAEPQIIEDPATLANFPSAVPKDLIVALAEVIELPPEVAANLPLVLPGLPDPLPLKYTYSFDAKFWVDPTTGILVDIERRDIRRAVLEIDILPAPVPITSVYDLEYSSPASTLEEAVDDAQSEGGRLNLYRSTLPNIAFILGGLLLLGGGAVLYFTRERDEVQVPPPPDAEDREPEEAV